MTLNGLPTFGLALDETTGAVLAGILVFITVIAFGQALVPHDPMAERLRSHQKRRDQLRAGILTANTAGSERKRANVGRLKSVLDWMKLLRGDDARNTGDQLAQAGWRSRDALVIYIGLRVALPFIGLIAVMRGLLIALVALLYGLFVIGTLLRCGWVRWIGLAAAIINLLLVLSVLNQGAPVEQVIAWSAVPVILMVFLFSPTGRAALKGSG